MWKCAEPVPNLKMFRIQRRTAKTCYYCDNKSWTMFYDLVVCIYMQSFAWFCMLILKICLTLRLSDCFWPALTSSQTYFYIKKIQTKKNKSRTKINIEKRFTPAFMILTNNLSNLNNLILTKLTKFILFNLYNEISVLCFLHDWLLTFDMK